MANKKEVQALYEAYRSGTLHKLWGPRTVEIEITNNCNLRCKMCSRWKWSDRGTRLGLDTLKNLIREAKELGAQNVLISGGEPLIRPDFLDIVKEIHRNGMKIILFTNGTLMNEEAAKELVAAGDRLVFSLDSSKPGIYEGIRGVEGAWEKALRGVRIAAKANKRLGNRATVGINYTTQKDNVSDMYDTAKLAKSEGLNYIRFGLVHGQEGVGLGEDEIPMLKAQIENLKKLGKEKGNKINIMVSQYFLPLLDSKLDREYVRHGMPALKLFEKEPLTCYVCSQFALIDSFGDVYPCTYSYLDNDMDDSGTKRLRKENCLGNIFEKPLRDIWNSDRYGRFRKDHSPVDISKHARVCGQCEHYFGLKAIDEYFKEMDRKKGDVAELISDNAWCGCNDFEIKV